jgi:hypothetical protein
MKLLLFFLAFTLIISCNNSKVSKSFSDSDSLVIHFKDELAGVITKTVETTEAKAISRVTGFIDAATTENFKCGYDGKMFFYRKGQQLQEVDLMLKDKACRHFSFLLDGKIMSTKMNNEAAEFLSSLESGKMWY